MRARSTTIAIAAGTLGVLAIVLATMWLANQHAPEATSEISTGEPYPGSQPSTEGTQPQPGGGIPAKDVDPAPAVPDTQVIVRDPEPGTEQPETGIQTGEPTDSASGGGGGGSNLGEQPTLPDVSAPGSGSDDYSYLDNLGSTYEEQERLHYQEQAAREEQAVREAQRRYEEELARQQQQEAQAGAEQTQAEEAVPPPDTAIEPQPLPPPPIMAPEQPAAVEMVRHPTLDAPDEVISGQEFTCPSR